MYLRALKAFTELPNNGEQFATTQHSSGYKNLDSYMCKNTLMLVNLLGLEFLLLLFKGSELSD